ncbi:hypothetical protein BG004_003257, partial [Podila humilis]
MSKQEEFDLYDDPYVASSGSGGADPYAEDDDDFYNSSNNINNSNNNNNNSAIHHSSSSFNEIVKSEDSHDVSVKHESGDHSRPSDHDSYNDIKHEDDGYNGGSNNAPTGGSGYDQYNGASRDPYSQAQQQQQQGGQGHGSPYSRQQQPALSSYNSQGNNGGSYGQQAQQQQQPVTPSGREHGKMFIGGLNWETTDESLKAYFAKYGELTDCMVMKDTITGKSRGFGFLTFVDSKNVDAVLKEDHYLDGKM